MKLRDFISCCVDYTVLQVNTAMSNLIGFYTVSSDTDDLVSKYGDYDILQISVYGDVINLWVTQPFVKCGEVA